MQVTKTAGLLFFFTFFSEDFFDCITPFLVLFSVSKTSFGWNVLTSSCASCLCRIIFTCVFRSFLLLVILIFVGVLNFFGRCDVYCAVLVVFFSLSTFKIASSLRMMTIYLAELMNSLLSSQKLWICSAFESEFFAILILPSFSWIV